MKWPFITATDFGVSNDNSTFAQATVTRVNLGPGDSLTYQLEWTLTGPYGQGALQTLPLTGPCDS